MLPLASSRGSLNAPDAKDTAEIIRSFEEQNRVRVVITLRPTRGTDKVDFWLEGKILSEHDANGVRSLLAFASVQCLASNHKTTDAAILALLYALDFQLAEGEFRKAGK